jgi:hypothetical protein
MKINLEGGYIETTKNKWKDAATGETNSFWRSHSKWTQRVEIFYTKGLAEFTVWVINEVYQSRQQRMSIDDFTVWAAAQERIV